MFSLEMPEDIIQVERNACIWCNSLRNVALPSNAVVEQFAFFDCLDLLQLFYSEEAIVNALKN
jgi:hypothetical protein